MVYGAVNRKGEKYYTYLKKLFDAINNKQLDYNWLITDCTCYPENPKRMLCFARIIAGLPAKN